MTVRLADALALALGFGGQFLDYLPQVAPSALEYCPAAANLNAAELRQTVDERMQEMKGMLGLFAEGSQKKNSEGDSEGSPTGPSVTYIAARPSPLDPLALWLQYAMGCTLTSHGLDGLDGETKIGSVVVVNLGDVEPAPERLSRLEYLLGQHRGILAADALWAEHLAGAGAAGWQVFPEPIPLRGMRAALLRAGAGA